jgi:hypothetical protein
MATTSMYFGDCLIFLSLCIPVWWVCLLGRPRLAATHQAEEAAATTEAVSRRLENHVVDPSPDNLWPSGRRGRPRARSEPEMLAVERRLEYAAGDHKEASR